LSDRTQADESSDTSEECSARIEAFQVGERYPGLALTTVSHSAAHSQPFLRLPRQAAISTLSAECKQHPERATEIKAQAKQLMMQKKAWRPSCGAQPRPLPA
jgi:hypothetical protein